MSDNRVSYILKLKNQLCCYVKLLDAIQNELLIKDNTGKVGTSICEMTIELFSRMIEDPQISLYDSCSNPVLHVGFPVEFYGVRLLECNGDLVDQYHASFLVKNNDQTSYISDLVNSYLELFQSKVKCDTDYLQAICKLKQHFMYIREILCHNLS